VCSHGHGGVEASRTVFGTLKIPYMHKGVLTRVDGSLHVPEDEIRADKTSDKSCRHRDAGWGIEQTISVK
jgi:hypothetical protein